MTDTDDEHRPVRTLVDRLAEQDVESRREAISELEELLGERPGHVAWGRETILRRLEDPDPTVRATACRIIAALGIKEARSQLDDLRLDPDTTVSNVASESLPRLREADRVEPVEPPVRNERGVSTQNEQPRSTRNDEAASEPGTQGTEPNAATSGHASQPRSNAESEQPHTETAARQPQQPDMATQSQNAAATHGDRTTRPNAPNTQPESTPPAEQRPETAAGNENDGRIPPLAVTAGYGLLGLFFVIDPFLLVDMALLYPPDPDMPTRYDLLVAVYLAVAGGIITFVAAALRGSGRSAETSRKVAIFGSLLGVVGIMLIFFLL
jgi:hypothetical protein